MLEVLVWIEAVALFVAAPALALYFRERVKNVAREETDRALAIQRHHHEQALAATNAEHSRRLEEFGLYARKQHSVYPRLYARYREAVDLFAGMIGLTTGTDFRPYTIVEAKEYVARHEVPASLANPICKAYEQGEVSKARSLLDDLELRLKNFRANKAFARAKNYEAVYDLYQSDEVRSLLNTVRHQIAVVSVELGPDGREPDEPRSKVLEKREAMMTAMSQLYHQLRKELRRGESAPTPKVSS